MTARFDYETNKLYMFEIIDDAEVIWGVLYFPKDGEIPDKIIISLKPYSKTRPALSAEKVVKGCG